MPDRYGDRDDDPIDPAPDDIWAAEQRAADVLDKAARDACDLCDDEGYRHPERTVVCDHIDRSETAARGAALVREALEVAKAKREGGVA